MTPHTHTQTHKRTNLQTYKLTHRKTHISPPSPQKLRGRQDFYILFVVIFLLYILSRIKKNTINLTGYCDDIKNKTDSGVSMVVRYCLYKPTLVWLYTLSNFRKRL